MVDRGQIVVVDVIQADVYNRKMTNTVVAMITTNLARASEPSHFLIDLATAEGSRSGLLYTSVVNCNTLTTVRQDDILRVLGSLSPAAMQQIDECLKAALAIA